MTRAIDLQVHKVQETALTFVMRERRAMQRTRSLKRSTTMTKKEMKRISNSATFTSLNTDSTALVSSDRWSAARCGCLRIGTFSSSPPLSPSPLPLCPSSSSSSSFPASLFLKPFWSTSVALKLCCCTDLCRTYIEAEHARGDAAEPKEKERRAAADQKRCKCNNNNVNNINTQIPPQTPASRTKLSKPSPASLSKLRPPRRSILPSNVRRPRPLANYAIPSYGRTSIIYRPKGGSSFALITIVLHGSPVDALKTLLSALPVQWTGRSIQWTLYRKTPRPLC